MNQILLLIINLFLCLVVVYSLYTATRNLAIAIKSKKSLTAPIIRFIIVAAVGIWLACRIFSRTIDLFDKVF